ncbi:MAG: glycoside hydrolase family 3 N-terminal domain-containing protein [Lachnospiraceae bacterium]
MYREFDCDAEKILSSLSLKEKIGQLNQVIQPDADTLEELKESIRRGEVGSVILSDSATAGNDEQQAILIDMINDLQKCAVEESASGIPLIFGRDVIHGHHTVYPIPLASACSFNPDLITSCYRCIAEEASNNGVHWTFAPMLDVCHDPRWGRIIEGPGEDPFVGSMLARASIAGFQGENLANEDSLAACAKHYLGYGASEGGRDYFRTELSDYTVYNHILPPFRAAVEAGAATVMSSFNDINGQPVTSSYKYLTDILRNKLGFEGFVISDWNAIEQLKKQGVAKDNRDCAKLAILAGLDMDMVDRHYLNELEDLVLSGEVPEEVIDTSVLRILRVKLAKGLFKHPYCIPHQIDTAKHIHLAEELAAESMVLLKNDKQTLPLNKSAKIALAGPFVKERRALHGNWTLDGDVSITPNLFEAMTEIAEKEGGTVSINDNPLTANNATGLFANRDVVVLALGESHLVSGEARCMADISLSVEQIYLAKMAHNSGKKVIGIIFCGRPVALESVEPYLDAILCAWHGGTMCASAAAKILYGEYVPSGKTVTTFVRTTGHIPLYYNTTPSGRFVNRYYGENGQPDYMDIPGTPMYPFGYGLSYTTFAISPIAANAVKIPLDRLLSGEQFLFTVTVRNTGAYDGKEVVQLYIHDLVASLMRPMRELKASQKAELKQGESREVTFPIGAESLGYYNNDGIYTVEKGQFDIYIGDNCLTENKITIEVI